MGVIVADGADYPLQLSATLETTVQLFVPRYSGSIRYGYQRSLYTHHAPAQPKLHLTLNFPAASAGPGSQNK